MIEEGLYEYLLSRNEITAIIGDRIAPLALPEKTSFPAITYMRISNGRSRSHSGKALSSPVIQISCWGKTQKDTRELAENVIEALDNYSGSMGGIKVNSFHENDRDIYEPDTQLFHIPIDFEVNYE